MLGKIDYFIRRRNGWYALYYAFRLSAIALVLTQLSNVAQARSEFGPEGVLEYRKILCAISAGTAAVPSNSISLGSSTELLLLDFETGATLQWEQSTDGVNFADVIGGNGETTPIYTTPGLSTVTYYRARVTKGCVAYSNVLIITPFLADYCVRKKVTIHHEQIPGSDDLIDFPVLVKINGDDDLRSTTYGGFVKSSSGHDIVFTDISGVAELNHEIEFYDETTGEYIAWVNVPIVAHDADTELYLNFGFAGAADPEIDAVNTWNSSYQAIWHLSEDPSTGVYNSKNGVVDGTANGGMSINNSVDGPINRALDFDGSNEYIDFGTTHQITGSNSRTYQAWIYARDFSAVNGAIQAGRDSNRGNFSLKTQSTTDGWTVDVNGDDINATLTDSENSWHQYVMSYNQSTDVIKLYYDGTLVATESASPAINTGIDNVLLGEVHNTHMNGIIDELRISAVALSDSWIAAEYNNINDPDGFLTVGPRAFPLNTGLASADKDWILSGETVVISLNGNSSPTVQWQSSTDGTNYTDITDETEQKLIISPNESTFYRAKVSNGSCEGFSNDVLVALRPAFITGYCTRKLITIDHSKVVGTSDHTNFPVLIKVTDPELRSTGNGGLVESLDGYDIVFTDDTGGNGLFHQIDQYDPVTGQFIAWVQVPALSTSQNTLLYLYFGKAGATNPSNANTWDSSYAGVWHFNETGLPGDGTIHNNDADYDGTEVIEAKIGTGRSFAGGNNSTSYITVPNSNSLNITGTTVTVEVWARWFLPVPRDSPFVVKSPGTNQERYMLGLDGNTTTRARINRRVTTQDADDDNNGKGNTNGHFRYDDFAVDAAWHHMVMVYDGNTSAADASEDNLKTYVDGVLQTPWDYTGPDYPYGSLKSTTEKLFFGRRNDQRRYKGLLDEIRVSNVARSGDWITTEYNSQNDPSSFYTISEIEYNLNPGTASAEDVAVDLNLTTDLALAGQSGSIIQWQESTDNFNFSQVILGIGAMTPNYTTAPLDQTTYFRAEVNNGGCTGHSNSVKVIVRPPFQGGFSSRKKITIDPDKVDGTGNLTDFPVLVSITDADLKTVSNGGRVYFANGQDIVFTDGSSNALDYEIEKYEETTGALQAWVKAPTLFGNAETELFMYFGNCNATVNTTSEAVWDADFQGVWHLDQNDDATSNGNDGTTNGNPTFVDGFIGDGIDFDGNGDYLTFGTLSNIYVNNPRTIEAWVYNRSFNGAGLWQAGSENGNDFSFRTSNTDNNWFQEHDGVATEKTLAGTLDGWNHIAITYTNGVIAIYQNGQFFDQINDFLRTTSHPVRLARWDNDGDELNGIVDEFRVSSIARSAAWIATQYNNQSDPGSFLRVGLLEIEYQWTGSSSTAWSLADNWGGCALPESGADILIEEVGTGNYPVLDQPLTVVGQLVIGSGASLDVDAQVLDVAGNLRVDGTLSASNGTVVFNGVQNQFIAGATSISLNDVMVDKSGAVLKYVNPLEVTGVLALAEGFLEVEDSRLTFGPNASTASESSTSFIITNGAECVYHQSVGTGTKAGNILFPIGTGTSSYTPATLKNDGTVDNFCVRVENDVLEDGTSGPIIDLDVVNKTWMIDEDIAGGSDVTMALQWNHDEENATFDRSGVNFVHYDGSFWQSVGTTTSATLVDGNSSAYNFSGIREFSPWSVESSSAPLPIELAEFSAELIEGVVNLHWKTISEQDNDFFTVERANDPAAFETLSTVDGAGNSNVAIDYHAVDEQPLAGVSYYRLKQTDFNGDFSYSPVAVIENYQDNQAEMLIYPNPTNGHAFNIVLYDFEPDNVVQIDIYDLSGNLINQHRDFTDASGTLNLNYQAVNPMSPGIYFIKASLGQKQAVKRLIVR